MTKQELLVAKIEGEYEKFIDGLLARPKSQIVDSATEIYIREQIFKFLREIENTSEKEKEDLLQVENVLDECFAFYVDMGFEEQFAFYCVMKELVNRALNLTVGSLF